MRGWRRAQRLAAVSPSHRGPLLCQRCPLPHCTRCCNLWLCKGTKDKSQWFPAFVPCSRRGNGEEEETVVARATELSRPTCAAVVIVPARRVAMHGGKRAQRRLSVTGRQAMQILQTACRFLRRGCNRGGTHAPLALSCGGVAAGALGAACCCHVRRRRCRRGSRLVRCHAALLCLVCGGRAGQVSEVARDPR